MKYLILTSIFLMIIKVSIFPQDLKTCGAEIYITADHDSEDYPLNITLYQLSFTWGGVEDITTQCEVCDDSSSENFESDMLEIGNEYGWNRSQDGVCSSIGTYGYGIYKLYNDSNNEYFYLDTRDCEYWDKINGYPNSTGDGENDVFFLSKPGGFQYAVGEVGGNYYDIIKGEFLTIREMWDKHPDFNLDNSLKTGCFQNFWANSLFVAGGVFDASQPSRDHPLIIWGRNPNIVETDYKIYKAVSTLEFNPENINPEDSPSGVRFLLS
jgi:hypothetical protein